MTEKNLQYQSNMPPPIPWLPVKKTRKKPTTTVIVIAIFVAIMVFGTLLIVGAGIYGVKKIVSAREDTKTTLDAFMKEMDSKNPEKAFWLLSPGGRKYLNSLDLRYYVEHEYYVLYQGYKGIQYTGFRFDAMPNSDNNYPHGIYVIANGIFSYKDGSSRDFTVVFEKVDGKWMIYYLDIPFADGEYQLTT
jgi:hypothetical protein